MDSIDFSNIDKQRKYNINLYKKINTGKHLYHKICNTRKIGAGGSKKQVFTGVQCDNTPLLIPQDSLFLFNFLRQLFDEIPSLTCSIDLAKRFTTWNVMLNLSSKTYIVHSIVMRTFSQKKHETDSSHFILHCTCTIDISPTPLLKVVILNLFFMYNHALKKITH